MWLSVLAVGGAIPGAWALALPRGFYDDFPGFGRHWVSADGPYNEHLVRDVGGFFLALAAIAGLALWLGTIASARLTGLAWLVHAVPHLLYHLTHLGVYAPLDQVLTVASLVVEVLLPVLLLAWPGHPVPAAD